MQVQRVVGFTVGVAGIAVPAHQVELGDSILCRFLAARQEPPPLKRGDLVLVRVRESALRPTEARGTRGSTWARRSVSSSRCRAINWR